ncbi:MAG TPA: sigma factor [Bacteroidales bacterium]|nr:sigma factor [Bacteroidales bacterium]
MSKKDDNYYIKNSDLLAEIVVYKTKGRASEELGKMLLTIAENFSSKGSFAGYTWKKDMISEAVLTCLKYLKNFDEDKSQNAFAYITQICKNAFLTYIKEQNKHSDIKDICYREYMFLVNKPSSSAIDYQSIREKE